MRTAVKSGSMKTAIIIGFTGLSKHPAERNAETSMIARNSRHMHRHIIYATRCELLINEPELTNNHQNVTWADSKHRCFSRASRYRSGSNASGAVDRRSVRHTSARRRHRSASASRPLHCRHPLCCLDVDTTAPLVFSLAASSSPPKMQRRQTCSTPQPHSAMMATSFHRWGHEVVRQRQSPTLASNCRSLTGAPVGRMTSLQMPAFARRCRPEQFVLSRL